MNPPQIDPDERVFRRWFRAAAVATIIWIAALAWLFTQGAQWVTR